MDRRRVERWLGGYERAWRSPGTEALAELFTADVACRPSPWAEPVEGLEALAALWDERRQGHDESFGMRTEVLAVELETAVVRADVEYPPPRGRWRDLWVLTFSTGGRCARFEEWPAPEGPGRPGPAG